MARSRLVKGGTVLQPDFDLEPTTVRIHRCGYASKCKARRCLARAYPDRREG